MIFLIAESKTMTACSDKISAQEYERHHPVYAGEADAIMASLRQMSAEELASAVKISRAMAVRLHGMVYEFPSKNTGSRAIEAFTGVVFRAFDYTTLDKSERKTADTRLRIVSSLYGWLRPDDVIKAYRCDFTTRLAPDNSSMTSYWRKAVTDALLRHIDDTGSRYVVDLMPSDAARCIDSKIIGAKARIIKIDFKEIRNGSLRTPDAGRLKKLRGMLLRQMIREDVSTPDDIRTLKSDCYMAETDGITTDDRICFITITD
ncbi:MAG: YaaA family protein [Muribaculaceae bacterium]|nr:YaaA family protein [Muribaculaceae bacterium]